MIKFEYLSPINYFKEDKQIEHEFAVKFYESQARPFSGTAGFCSVFVNCQWPVQGQRGHQTQKAEDLSSHTACIQSLATHPAQRSSWKGQRHHACDSDGRMIQLSYKHRVSAARTNSYLYSKHHEKLPDSLVRTTCLSLTRLLLPANRREQQSHQPNTGNNIKLLLCALLCLMLLQVNFQVSSHLPLLDIKSSFQPTGTHLMSLEPSSKKACPQGSTK